MAESPTLTWTNVLIGLLFIVFDALLSLVLGLGVGGSLMVAALRCIVQLSIMGLVLDKVFASQNPWGVAGIARESLSLLYDTSLGLQLTWSATEHPRRIRGDVQQVQATLHQHGVSRLTCLCSIFKLILVPVDPLRDPLRHSTDLGPWPAVCHDHTTLLAAGPIRWV